MELGILTRSSSERAISFREYRFTDPAYDPRSSKVLKSARARWRFRGGAASGGFAKTEIAVDQTFTGIVRDLHVGALKHRSIGRAFVAQGDRTRRCRR